MTTTYQVWHGKLVEVVRIGPGVLADPLLICGEVFVSNLELSVVLLIAGSFKLIAESLVTTREVFGIGGRQLSYNKFPCRGSFGSAAWNLPTEQRGGQTSRCWYRGSHHKVYLNPMATCIQQSEN